MCQYIDISKIVNTFPENIGVSSYSPNHHRHPEILIEFPICGASEEILQSGETKSIQSCTILHNIPESHYLEFKGFATNIGVYSLSGVLKNSFSGYFYVTTHNSSIKCQRIPTGTHLGSLSIKRFYDAYE